MLNGFFRENNLCVNLKGYDLGNTFVFHVRCKDPKQAILIDKGFMVKGEGHINGGKNLWYASVSDKAISVSCFEVYLDDEKYANNVNGDYFQLFGSILRGLKNNCLVMNRIETLPDGTITHNIETKLGVESKYAIKNGITQLVDFGNSDTPVELHLIEDGKVGEIISKIENSSSRSHRIVLDLSDFETKQDSGNWLNGEEQIFSLEDIIKMNPNKSYAWLNNRDYEVISNIDRAKEVLDEIMAWDGVVAFDTETTGLNINFKSRTGEADRLVGMIFSIRPGQAWYFPIAHKKIDNICTEDNEKDVINKYFKPVLEKKDILCHNGAYDWKVMHIYDICMNLKHDTLVLFKLSYWNLNHDMHLGLKYLASQYLGRDSFELSDFVSGSWDNGDVQFWDLPYESVKYYACPDTDNTLELYLYALEKDLFTEFNMTNTYQIEVQFSQAVAYQEFYGHHVDVKRIPELQEKAAEEKEKEYQAMVEIVGHDFNPRSSKDLPKVLYDELGYPVKGKKTASGNRSCSSNILEILAKMQNSDGTLRCPLIPHLINWKANAQLESNFFKSLEKHGTSDGYLFSSVQQFLETGRVSINNPNYQSYNDLIKKYITPREGYYMLDADYSSVEYRILASIAGETDLIEKFHDPDMDYHTTQASRMFNIPYELVSKELRSQAKHINFGLPYGMGDRSLGENIFGEANDKNTKKAAQLRKKYFEGQNHVDAFFKTARADGYNNGYSETFFGRRRYFDKRLKNKGNIERESGNNRIQGTAADIYKMAMGKLITEVFKRGWQGKVLIPCFVHDECVLEISNDINPMVILKLLRECMMLDIPGWCPLYTGAGFGSCWYNAKKTEIPVQVQEKFVTEYGTDGLPWWDGDIDKLYHWEINEILEYKKGRVIDYLQDENNWNKFIKPVENTFAHEVLEDIDQLDIGVVCSECEPKKDPIDNLEEFCKAFGLEDLFAQANIQRPILEKSCDEGDAEVEPTALSDEEISKINTDIILSRLETMGICIDLEAKRIYIKLDADNDKLIKCVKEVAAENPGDISLCSFANDDLYDLGLSVNDLAYPELVSAVMGEV